MLVLHSDAQRLTSTSVMLGIKTLTSLITFAFVAGSIASNFTVKIVFSFGFSSADSASAGAVAAAGAAAAGIAISVIFKRVYNVSPAWG
jgi:hypothetical protein